MLVQNPFTAISSEEELYKDIVAIVLKSSMSTLLYDHVA
jgi:hypothetical protein